MEKIIDEQVFIITNHLADRLGAYIPNNPLNPVLKLCSTKYGVDDIKIGVAECNGQICSFESINPVSFTNIPSDILFGMLSGVQKDEIYRKVWTEYVREDVDGVLEERKHDLIISNDTRNRIVEEVSCAYVQGDYDCNLSYWDNINNLIEKRLEK